MSNREVAAGGQGIYPLNGDIESQAGVSTVAVTGIQGIPVTTTAPLDKQVLTFDNAANELIYADAGDGAFNKSISINGVVVSDDYDIGFNLPLSSTNSPIFINGA